MPAKVPASADRRSSTRRDILAARQNDVVPLKRAAWIVTVLICVLTAALLLLSGYTGYAGVFLAVGASAAINIS